MFGAGTLLEMVSHKSKNVVCLGQPKWELKREV